MDETIVQTCSNITKSSVLILCEILYHSVWILVVVIMKGLFFVCSLALMDKTFLVVRIVCLSCSMSCNMSVSLS